MFESFVPLALVGSTLTLLVLLLILIIFLWQRVNLLEQTGSLPQLTFKPEEKKGGALLGLRGRQIWKALESPEKHTEDMISELSRRYTFVLSRHIELTIDQGKMDSQRGRDATPGEIAAIGGLRGEVESWMPSSYVSRFYTIGQRSAVADEGEMAELRSDARRAVKELLTRLSMTEDASGIAALITSHTLDFNERARESEDDDEDLEGEEVD